MNLLASRALRVPCGISPALYNWFPLNSRLMNVANALCRHSHQYKFPKALLRSTPGTGHGSKSNIAALTLFFFFFPAGLWVFRACLQGRAKVSDQQGWLTWRSDLRALAVPAGLPTGHKFWPGVGYTADVLLCKGRKTKVTHLLRNLWQKFSANYWLWMMSIAMSCHQDSLLSWQPTQTDQVCFN